MIRVASPVAMLRPGDGEKIAFPRRVDRHAVDHGLAVGSVPPVKGLVVVARIVVEGHQPPDLGEGGEADRIA